jgi:hypothetical protein
MVRSVMSRTGRAISERWSGTLEQRSLADDYYELLALNPDELCRELREIAEAEYALSEQMRYPAVRARLAAWLELSREERRILAKAFERATATMPEGYRTIRREVERAAVMNGMSFDQFRELTLVLDWASTEAVDAA